MIRSVPRRITPYKPGMSHDLLIGDKRMKRNADHGFISLRVSCYNQAAELDLWNIKGGDRRTHIKSSPIFIRRLHYPAMSDENKRVRLEGLQGTSTGLEGAVPGS